MGNQNSNKSEELIGNDVLRSKSTMTAKSRKRLVANQQNNKILASNKHIKNIDFIDNNKSSTTHCFNKYNPKLSPNTSKNLSFSQRRAHSIAFYSDTSSNGSTKMTRQKPLKKNDVVPNAINLNDQNIIQFSYENAPLDFTIRLFTRIYEKRTDFQNFSQQMGREKWFEMAHNLHFFLQKAIAQIKDSETVEKLARKYGEEHLALKCYGFKPDFWVTLADLLTVEGVKLDQAIHTHTDIVSAWSLFVSMLFSSIRDGYYSAMRQQRNSIRKLSTREPPVFNRSNFSLKQNPSSFKDKNLSFLKNSTIEELPKSILSKNNT